MNRKLLVLIAVLSLAATLLPSQVRGEEEPGPFADYLFAPELVMEHQGAIELSAGQRRALIVEITQAQADFVPDQMEMAEKAEGLMRLLAESRVDEAATLEAAAEIMDLEGRIKRRHLALAIRIKNLLTEEQQLELASLRARRE